MKFKLSLDQYTVDQLVGMRDAGAVIAECYRVLAKAGANIVGQCLAHQGTFYVDAHYPKGDVYDRDTKSQYYYHAHRADVEEHGHFHTFVRAGAIPGHISPAPYDGSASRPLGADMICHLIAISMNRPGFPTGLFTTNRWVTGETFFAAEDAITILDRFEIDHTYPCWGVNRWITAMLILFKPQIAALLRARDREIEQWSRRNDGDVYEDRALEVTSALSIDVTKQVQAVDKALKHRHR